MIGVDWTNHNLDIRIAGQWKHLSCIADKDNIFVLGILPDQFINQAARVCLYAAPQSGNSIKKV